MLQGRPPPRRAPCPATIGCGARGRERLARLEVDLLDMGFQAGAVCVAIARHGNDKLN